MAETTEPPRYRAEDLHQFAATLLQNVGLPEEMAATPAESLVCAHGSGRPLFSTNPFAFAVPTGGDPILLDMSLALKRRQLAEGVALSPLVLPALEPWALKLGVTLPGAVGD